MGRHGWWNNFGGGGSGFGLGNWRPKKKKRSRRGAVLEPIRHRNTVDLDMSLFGLEHLNRAGPSTAGFSYLSQPEPINLEDLHDLEDETDDEILFGSLRANIVGIQYYRGTVNNGEMVSLVREPQNRYDVNAVRVDNVDGVQVGHIKRELAKALSKVMDNSLARVEGIVPFGATNVYTMPVDLTLWGKQEDKENVISQMAALGFHLRQPKETPKSAQPGTSVAGFNNVLDTRRVFLSPAEMKGELDKLFENLKEGDKTSEAEPAAAISTKMYPHQKQALHWMIARENGHSLPPFWEKRGSQYFNSITVFSTNRRPKSVHGGILADDMGLGKTLEMIALILTNFDNGKPLAVPVSGVVRQSKNKGKNVKRTKVLPMDKKAAETPGFEPSKVKVDMRKKLKLSPSCGVTKTDTPPPLPTMDFSSDEEPVGVKIKLNIKRVLEEDGVVSEEENTVELDSNVMVKKEDPDYIPELPELPDNVGVAKSLQTVDLRVPKVKPGLPSPNIRSRPRRTSRKPAKYQDSDSENEDVENQPAKKTKLTSSASVRIKSLSQDPPPPKTRKGKGRGKGKQTSTVVSSAKTKVICTLPDVDLTCSVPEEKVTSTCTVPAGVTCTSLPDVTATCAIPEAKVTCSVPETEVTCIIPEAEVTCAAPEVMCAVPEVTCAVPEVTCAVPETEVTCTFPEAEVTCSIPEADVMCDVPEVTCTFPEAEVKCAVPEAEVTRSVPEAEVTCAVPMEVTKDVADSCTTVPTLGISSTLPPLESTNSQSEVGKPCTTSSGKKGEANKSEVKDDSRVITTSLPGGITQRVFPDGMVETTLPSGVVQTILPSGAVKTSVPSSGVQTIHPNSQVSMEPQTESQPLSQTADPTCSSESGTLSDKGAGFSTTCVSKESRTPDISSASPNFQLSGSAGLPQLSVPCSEAVLSATLKNIPTSGTVFTSVPPSGASIRPVFTSVPPSGASIRPVFTSVPPSGASIRPVLTSVPPSGASIRPVLQSVPPSGAGIRPVLQSVPPSGADIRPVLQSVPPSGAGIRPVLQSVPPSGASIHGIRPVLQSVPPSGAGLSPMLTSAPSSVKVLPISMKAHASFTAPKGISTGGTSTSCADVSTVTPTAQVSITGVQPASVKVSSVNKGVPIVFLNGQATPLVSILKPTANSSGQKVAFMKACSSPGETTSCPSIQVHCTKSTPSPGSPIVLPPSGVSVRVGSPVAQESNTRNPPIVAKDSNGSARGVQIVGTAYSSVRTESAKLPSTSATRTVSYVPAVVPSSGASVLSGCTEVPSSATVSHVHLTVPSSSATVSHVRPVVPSSSATVSRVHPVVSSSSATVSRVHPVVPSSSATVSRVHPVVPSSSATISRVHPVVPSSSASANHVQPVVPSSSASGLLSKIPAVSAGNPNMPKVLLSRPPVTKSQTIPLSSGGHLIKRSSTLCVSGQANGSTNGEGPATGSKRSAEGKLLNAESLTLSQVLKCGKKNSKVIDLSEDDELPDIYVVDDDDAGSVVQKGSGSRASQSSQSVSSTESLFSGRTESEGPRGTLIICPLSVMSNWINQLEEHVHENVQLEVYMYYGSNRITNSKFLSKQDVVLTTYSTVSMDSKNRHPLKAVEWLRIVLDEGHAIRNPSAQQTKAIMELKARRKWVLTGTPIQNSMKDLWSIVNFLQVSPFTDKQWWRRTIERPLTAGENCALQRVRQLMGMIALRRTKTQEVNGKPLVSLPGKHVFVEHIKLSDEERKVYDSMQNSGQLVICKYFNQGTLLHHYGEVLAILMRLRQLCCHPQLVAKAAAAAAMAIETVPQNTPDDEIKQRLVQTLLEVLQSGSDEECSICLDSLRNAVITPCAHVYCRGCIEAVIRNEQPQSKCPLCRGDLTSDQLIEVPPEAEAPQKQTFSDADWQSSAKVDALMNALITVRQQDPSVKSLVVSQFTSLLRLLEIPLRKQGFTFTKLDGTMSAGKRVESIEEFSETGPDTPNIMLLSLKAGGVGINLTAATQVFLMDPAWNPASEEQCFDRCHRLGQTKDVTVTKFVIEDSVEERMLELQEKKRQLMQGAFGKKPNPEQRRQQRINDIRNLINL